MKRPVEGTIPRHPAAPPDLLARAFAQWRALPWSHHVCAVALLGMVGTAWFWLDLTLPTANWDESIYEHAFQAVEEGRSPYSVRGYYYPAASAYLGSWLDAMVGAGAVRGAMRLFNFTALIGTLWLATAWLYRPSRAPTGRASPWLERLVVAVLLLTVSPGISFGIELGNLSFLVIGLALTALLIAGRRPLLAGSLLAVSVGLKPIAAAALPLLLFSPPRLEARQYRIAGMLGGGMAALLFMSFPNSAGLLGQNLQWLAQNRAWSLHRLTDVLDLGIGHFGVFALVVLLAVIIGRTVPVTSSTRAGWLAFAAATCILATPLVWSHTLVLLFPVLMMAISIARFRRQHREARWEEPVFVGLGCAVVLFYNAGAIDRLARPLEVALLLVPVAVVVLLVGYVLQHCRPADPTP